MEINVSFGHELNYSFVYVQFQLLEYRKILPTGDVYSR